MVFSIISVKKLRRQKGAADTTNIDDNFLQIIPGKRSRESTEEEFEPDPPVFSRTLLVSMSLSTSTPTYVDSTLTYHCFIYLSDRIWDAFRTQNKQ